MSGDNLHDFSVARGETFSAVFYWTTLPLVSKAITGITQAASVVITAIGHGLLDGWRAAIVGAGGVNELNAEHFPPRGDDWHVATKLTPDTLQFNEVSSAEMSAYTAGGFLVYETPASLGAVTAVMTIADAPVDGTVLMTSSDAITLTLDDTAKTITATFDTAGLTWDVGYYDIKVTDAGKVTQIAAGVISIT